MFAKYIHAFSPSKIPACTQSVCKLGRAIAAQGLETGSCLQAAPNPGGGCEEAFGVWVMLGLTPASVGLILPPLEKQGSPACCAPSKLHQLPVFKQPKATLHLTLSTSSFSSSYWRCSSLFQHLTEAGKQRLWKREGHYLALVEGDL